MRRPRRSPLRRERSSAQRFIRLPARTTIIFRKFAKSCQLLLVTALAVLAVFAGAANGASQVSLSGTVVEGPIVESAGTVTERPVVASTVTAYAVDPASGANLRVLATAAIDAAGTFTLSIAPRAWPLRLVAIGGSFVGGPDAGTLDPTRTLVALLPSATTDIANISINPLTKFVDALAVARVQSGHRAFDAALSGARATIESFYALSTNPARLLPDYSVAGIGTDAGNLGLILGALVSEDQQLCPSAPGGLVVALAADISNGTFNGGRNGLAVPYCGGKLPAMAGTSDFQDALSGVQQLQYVSVAFAFG